MPEGDSVFYTASRLHAGLAGHVLTLADLRVPGFATVDLTGRQVLEVVARGKHLLARLDDARTLHTHLRMDGRWQVYRPGERWRGGPPDQIRAVLGNTQCTAVGYRLPIVEVLRTSEEERAVGHLGPDLLGPDWDPVEAVRRLTAEPTRTVAEALLDQRNLAGVGNVYANELCFLRGVTPWTPVGGVGRPERLVDLAHRMLTANRLRHGHITTGDTRPGRQHWVYGRSGTPCLRCRTTVLRATVGTPPQDRVAFWCPSCQRGPAPAGSARRN